MAPKNTPLAGTRVVSLAVNLPGPLAASRLREMGAEVIKVEPPSGDPLDAAAPRWYAELTEGQTVMCLDLKDLRERAKLDIELAQSDVLITSYRPSALQRLGLHGVHRLYPQLTHVEIVGHDGDSAELAGHDLTYQAAYGTITPPALPTVPVVDMLGAERAVSATLSGLIECARTRVGQHRRVVLEDAAAFAGAAVRHGVTGAGAPLGGANPAYGIYATADGHVALAALEPHFWSRTLDALGVCGDRAALEGVFATRTSDEWRRLAQRVDIPLAVIQQGVS